MLRLASFIALAFSVSSCTLIDAGAIPCDDDKQCGVNELCTAGFCAKKSVAGEGEGGEGEGALGGEGEGGRGAEGEGARVGEGEGEGGNGEGEGEGAVAGEGEGAVAGEGEGEGAGPGQITLCTGGPTVSEPAWFDTSFARREALSFCDDAAPNEDVVDLPVTVFLDADVFDFTTAKADGSDVFFVDGRTNAILPFENTVFDATNKTALFFVRVPAFNPHTETDSIWMYWDNAAATSKANVTATWSGHSQVWHMDDLPNDFSLVGDNTKIKDTVTGKTATNPLAATFNDTGKEFVFGLSGFLHNSLVLDGGGVVFCGTNCTADSFVILPPPPNVTASTGSISMIVGAITETNSQNNVTKSGIGGSGCANGDADCGHLWFLGEKSGSTGFDNKSIHASVFSAGQAGLSRPSNPSTAGNFAASTTPAAPIPQNGFAVVSATWSASEMDVTVTTINTDFTLTQTVISSTKPVVSFGITNFVLGVAEGNGVFDHAGDLFGSVEEIRVSPVTRDAAFVRAEAGAHLGGLVIFSAIETVPPP